MKTVLVALLKHNRWLYWVYTTFFSFFLRFIGLFLKTNNHIILFNSYGGKKFDDSPYIIYQLMLQDPRYAGYKLVWAFHKPELFDLPTSHKVRTDTIKFYLIAMQACCWVTNTGIERGLVFRKKRIFYINTWHGTPIKRLGAEINESFAVELMRSKCDKYCAQGKYDLEILSRFFKVDKSKFLFSGLPRNDVLASCTMETRKNLKIQLGIEEKKIILYVPTFRDYEKDKFHRVLLAPPIDFQKWKGFLGNDYIVLFRAHYLTFKVLDIDFNDGFVLNMSDYPKLNDLLIAADILISDYSSIFFDYSILERPMLAYTYDYEEYERKRGLYFDIRKELVSTNSEDELLSRIKDIEKIEYNKELCERSRAFRDAYVEWYGNATEQVLDEIHKRIAN